jgi:phage shock protein A
MENTSKRVNTRENLRKKVKGLKTKIHQLKYAVPIALTLLATSCGNKEKHTPEYQQAEKELNLAKEQMEKAEENMENVVDYEDAKKDYEDALKNLEEAKKKMDEMGKNLPTTTTSTEGQGRDKYDNK